MVAPSRGTALPSLPEGPGGSPWAVARRLDPDGGVLREEAEREAARRRDERALVAAFTTGPRIELPLQQMRVNFDPRAVVPVEGLGQRYGSLTLEDVWGTLTVKGGRVLISSDWMRAVLAMDDSEHPLKGMGYTLDLAPGWHLVPHAKGRFEAKQR